MKRHDLFYDQISIDQIVKQLYPSKGYDYFSLHNVLNQIGKDQLTIIESELDQEDINNGIDLIRFLQLFLPIVPHSEDHLIYLTIALIEIFREISETIKLTKITMKDFTDYMCEYFGDTTKTQLQCLQVPMQKQFNPQKQTIRQIDLVFNPYFSLYQEPALIMGSNPESIKRFKLNLQTDSLRHKNQTVSEGCYCKELDKIITADQLATQLNVYNVDCSIAYNIEPKQQINEKQAIILSFAWSDKQKRIGISLKDQSLCFCDNQDHFKFQKRFSVHQLQNSIWYLEFFSMWITTDKANVLYEWNLEREQVTTKYSHDQIQSVIVDLKEIVHLKLLASASLDKKVFIWDLAKQIVKIIIEIPIGGVHSILYSYDFQLIFTAGYENRINVFSIHPTICDYELKGKFLGSASMITAIQLIQNSNYLVSIDDFGCVRLWDIRTLKCIQQLSIGNKAKITKIVDVSNHNLMAFIGCRLNTLGLDSSQKQKDTLYPLRVELHLNHLIVATKKDIRFFSVQTGRLVKKINMPEEVSYFHSFGKIYIIGNQRGQMTIYNQNFEPQGHMIGHTNEIIHMKYDSYNELLISAGIDNRILIQKFTKHLHREINNIHAKLLEISIYHNLIVTSSGSNVQLFDYELGRLLSIIEIQNEEVTALGIIKGYPIILIATTNSLIHIIKFAIKEQTFVNFQQLGTIDVSIDNQEMSEVSAQTGNLKYNRNSTIFDLTKMNSHGEIKFITKIVPDVNEQKTHIFTSTASGQVMRFDLREVVSNVEKVQHANQRVNYNPFRYGKEDFVIAKQKVNIEKIKQCTKIYECLIMEFQAHRDLLTGMSLISLNEWYLVTYSCDACFKFWSMQGDNIAAVNINHPLPILWNVEQENSKKFKQQFLYAMKALQALMQVDLTQTQRDSIQIDNFLNKLVQTQRSQEHQAQQERIYLMKDEYSPRDLKYEQVKNLYETGPTLKAMQLNKKMDELQNSWNKQEKKIFDNERMRQIKEKIRQKSSEKEQSISFLDENFHLRLLDQKLEERYIRSLRKKLDKQNKTQESQSQRKISQNQKFDSSIKRRKKGYEDFYDYANKKIGDSVDSTQLKTQRTQINSQKKRIKNIISTLNEQVKQSKSSLSLPKLDGSSYSLDISYRQQINNSSILPKIGKQRGVDIKETQGQVEKLLQDIRREADQRIQKQNGL